MNEVIAVVERHDLHVFRQVVVLYLLYLRFEICDNFLRVLSLMHDDDAFHHIVLTVTAYLTETRLATLMHRSEVAYEDRCAMDVLHHDISDLPRVVDETDTAHDISLWATLDDIASDIHITVGDGVEEFETRHAVGSELVRVDLHFIGLHLATEGHDISHARHTAELALDHPVLQGLQFSYRPLVTFQRITIDLACRPR